MSDETQAFESAPFPLDRLGDLNALLETSAVLNATHDLGDVLRTILQIATRVVNAEASSLVLVEVVGDALVCQVALGSKGRVVEQQLRLPVGKGIVGWVVEHGQPVCVNDVQADQRFYGGLDELTGFKTVSVLCVPMIARQRTVGAIEVLNARHPDGFQPADQALLTALATQAAIAIDNTRLHEQLSQENQALRNALHVGGQLVGDGPAMTAVKEWIARIAPSDASVLIRGASGTGKELVARALHDASPRALQPIVCVTCSVLPDQLIESELFGHEKGAFTGADARRIGRFELADGGTVFLDEVGALNLSTQVKLLRFLQEREFERVGSNQTQQVDVRVVAATNEDLEVAIQEGRFREDLYYRLKVMELTLPLLSERREDVPVLVSHFLELLGEETGQRIDRVDVAVMSCLQRHHWPGNVRELKNVIERAVVMSDDHELHLEHLPEELRTQEGVEVHPVNTLQAMEEQHIRRVLQQTGGNKSEAARILGISRNRLNRKLEKQHGR